jgi:hypothetical protein
MIRRGARVLLVTGLVAAPVEATWSLAVMNVRTREVVIAGATCLSDLGLINYIGSVAVGEGGGLSQAVVFQGGKVRIFNGLKAGLSPQEILDDIMNVVSSPEIRAFGIVGRHGPPVNFLGEESGVARLGVVGVVGDLRYSIQGSGLAGEEVISRAETALLMADGDMGQRVMAAMEAAATMGGDGRCSCDPIDPPSCGAPPPSFTHSAYTAFLAIARLGDSDNTATCMGGGPYACANGDYYARLWNKGTIEDPDPVRRLQRQYYQWRLELIGRPDQLLTEVYTTDQLVQADGLDSTSIDVALVDVDGNPVTVGGQTLVATAVEDPGVTISSITDNGDGTFHISVLGGHTPGHVRMRLVVQDGVRDVQLVPDVEFDVVAPQELFANRSSLSAAVGGQVQFDIFDPSTPGGGYHILGSGSGTRPGTPWGGLTLPLNADRLLRFTVLEANGPALPNTLGSLDSSGRATGWINLRAQDLFAYVGGQFDFTAYRPGNPARVTNLVGVQILP